MSLQDISTAIKEKTLPVSIAQKYLKLYIADIDWEPYIANLWKNACNKFSTDLAKEYVKKAIACATILPLIEKTPIPDPPSNLLFWCTGWRQFNEQDWFTMLLEVMQEDLIITENRNKIIKIGIIDPIDVSPITRQAYNWLYEKVSDEFNGKCSDELNEKIINLVRAYGGAVICNMFIKHKVNIDKVLNWRSGYFFEKQIYKVYNIDQIIKIKTAELNKTNKKYIRKIGAENG